MDSAGYDSSGEAKCWLCIFCKNSINHRDKIYSENLGYL